MILTILYTQTRRHTQIKLIGRFYSHRNTHTHVKALHNSESTQSVPQGYLYFFTEFLVLFNTQLKCNRSHCNETKSLLNPRTQANTLSCVALASPNEINRRLRGRVLAVFTCVASLFHRPPASFPVYRPALDLKSRCRRKFGAAKLS